LPFDATAGDWKMSLPCPVDDLSWVQRALSSKSTRISARDMEAAVAEEDEIAKSSASSSEGVDLEAFFKS
jgi:hypothetical protein